MLSFDAVSYGYDGRPEAVRGVTFTVSQGEWVALMGANGCGKSTVARLACGLIQPTAGMVVAPSVGFIAQDPEANIVGDTVGEDVAYGLAPGGTSDGALRRRSDACLALLGLSGYRERAMHALSGGELQRAAVAAALAADVELLVLDEPTSHLPRAEGLAFGNALRALAADRKLSVLYITHHPEEARLADRAIVLSQGRIALEGGPKEVLFREKLLADLGARPDLGLCVERLLVERGLVDQGNADLEGEGLEWLVERVCSAFQA